MKLSKEGIVLMTKDIIKLITVAIVYQILSYIIDNEISILDEYFLKKLTYLIIGLIIYHILIKITYESKINKKKLKILNEKANKEKR